MPVRLTIALTDEEMSSLDSIARYEAVDVETLLRRAARTLIDSDAAFEAAVEEGRASARQGPLVEVGESRRQMASYMAAREAEPKA